MGNDSDYRQLFVGMDVQVPLLNGQKRKYINFDNAASTPPMLPVKEKVDQFMVYYSSVHRGTGFKSQISTHLYEESRMKVLQFVGADPQTHVCIFGKNTTEAINKLAHRFPFTPEKNIVLVSTQEHHSNDLPWRKVAQVIHIGLTPQGALDEADYDRLLWEYKGRVAIVSITGASNVTGFINPVHRMAEKAHAAGALICVDCAQLAPHRKIDMHPVDSPDHLDFVTISAHKMYAPFGTGALIGRRDFFATGDPDMVGGGEVEIVTLDSVEWSEPPDRDEAGSPNTIGAIALAASITTLERIGMQAVADHEAELTTHILSRLTDMPYMTVLGDRNPENAANRLGVIPLNMNGISHYLLAAILGYEYGIGVRNGCFCAHPYLLKLMNIDEIASAKVRASIMAKDKRDVPGLVRISFGLYNTANEIDTLLQALEEIHAGKYQGKYHQDPPSGAYLPDGVNVDFNEYCSLEN